MIEIKFRGQVKYNGDHRFSGDWVYGYYYEKMDKHFIIETTEDEHYNISYDHIEVKLETIGQYIGRKDKYKNEIYVGDFIKSTTTRAVGFIKDIFTFEWITIDLIDKVVSGKTALDRFRYLQEMRDFDKCEVFNHVPEEKLGCGKSCYVGGEYFINAKDEICGKTYKRYIGQDSREELFLCSDCKCKELLE